MNFQFPFMGASHPFVQALLEGIGRFPGCEDVSKNENIVVAVGPSIFRDDWFTGIQWIAMGNPSEDQTICLLESAKTDIALFHLGFPKKIISNGAVGGDDVLNGRVWSVAGFPSDEMNAAFALCYGVMQTLQLNGRKNGLILPDATQNTTQMQMESVFFGPEILEQWKLEANSFLNRLTVDDDDVFAKVISTVWSICFQKIKFH
ncbi:MAG: hypothetical protein HGB03_02945 [Candidatus Yonathbacteria bacterium]|nr:hypothetical protein [Candidatus Yonathbacteria bacterium]NTW47408.1 hypothetical protein [Candidatus Yonathbacteria bacterium]